MYMPRMISQLAVATFMVLLTVTIHGFGLLLLTRVLRLEWKEEREANQSPLSAGGIMLTFGIVLGLFLLHGIEIWAYAAVFLQLGALPDLETAVYFSTVTYSTLGYDDDALATSWQLVAAIEGINGVLLMGWSTAFFISMIGRLRRG